MCRSAGCLGVLSVLGWLAAVAPGVAEPPADTDQLTTLTVAAARSLVKKQMAYRDDLRGRMYWIDLAAASFRISAVHDGRLLGGQHGRLPEMLREVHRSLYLSLGGVEQISPEVAAALARYEGSWLGLDGLKELTPEVARQFAPYKGVLDLGGLKQLSPEAAAALEKFEGGLRLDGLEVISPAVLAALKTGHDSHGRSLSLDGLQELPPAVLAEFTPRHVGGCFVSLDGLRDISRDALERLMQAKPCGLSLGGLQSLAAETLPSLAPTVRMMSPSGNVFAATEAHLRLDGLRQLSPAVAEKLAGGRYRALSLDGLQTLSRESAAALARNAGSSVLLNGLAEIPPEVIDALLSGPRAEGWEHRPGLYLSGLRGVRRLSPAAALALARQELLYLPGITELTPAIAAALGQHSGGLVLVGVTEIDRETATALTQYTRPPARPPAILHARLRLLNLDGIESLSSDVATALAGYDGVLSLGGVRELTPEAAAALETHERGLCLGGLRALPPDVAAALGRCAGPLDLSGVEELAPEAAAALAGHRTALNLRGLRRLSPAAATALIPHQGLLVLGTPALAGPEAAALANHAGGLQFGDRRLDIGHAALRARKINRAWAEKGMSDCRGNPCSSDPRVSLSSFFSCLLSRIYG